MIDWLFMPSTEMSNGCGSRPALPTVIARPRYARHCTLPASTFPPTESTTRSTPRPPVMLAHHVDPTRLRVVDGVVEAQRLQRFEPVEARRGGDDGRAGALGELDRGDADATRAGLDQHRLAGLQVAELEEAVVRGAERHRDARALDEVGAFGDHPGDHRRRGDHRRVRTPEAGRDDALADEPVGDTFADFDDRSRALVADDVRVRGHLAAGAVQRVAALDADRADLDQDAARARDRVGDILVAEDFRGAGLVVDGCFHGVSLRVQRVAKYSSATRSRCQPCAPINRSSTLARRRNRWASFSHV